jgi:hypothetical protein
VNLVHAFGPGLQQAQIGVQTSFTIDARDALNSNEDVKIVVTSKILIENKIHFNFLIS